MIPYPEKPDIDVSSAMVAQVRHVTIVYFYTPPYCFDLSVSLSPRFYLLSLYMFYSTKSVHILFDQRLNVIYYSFCSLAGAIKASLKIMELHIVKMWFNLFS